MSTSAFEDWDLEADVVVVGSGAAAFGAALAAAGQGCEVIVLERAEFSGGTTAKSGAYMWIPNNPLMRAQGFSDPRDGALRYMARLSFPQKYNPKDQKLGLSDHHYDLIATYYDTASVMVEEFAGMGVNFGLDPTLPDYNADLPEDEAPYGRHLYPASFDPTRHGTMGEALIEDLAKAAEARGVRILLGHRVSDVIRDDDGRAIGVEARVGRRTVVVRAKGGIVFGSGGFSHNPELTIEYLRGPFFGSCASAGCTGDFVRIGQKLGAKFGNMSNAWWQQAALEMVVHSGHELIEGIAIPFGDSMMMVDRFGRRAVNEKMPYNERSQVHFHWNPTHREYSNLLLFMIYDETVANWPSVTPMGQTVLQLAGGPGGAHYVISGNTWEELGANIQSRLTKLAEHTGGVRLDDDFVSELQQTVKRFNDFALTGKDLDFGRGDTPIQGWYPPGTDWRMWPTRDREMPNPTMHPFSEQGPYHAIIVTAATLDTKGGPVINSHSQVLDSAGEPIPGLYGAGNCIAAPAGQGYWGGGGTIGPALTFGYIAGIDAAKSAKGA